MSELQPELRAPIIRNPEFPYDPRVNAMMELYVSHYELETFDDGMTAVLLDSDIVAAYDMLDDEQKTSAQQIPDSAVHRMFENGFLPKFN
jgi:hypothetical protein